MDQRKLKELFDGVCTVQGPRCLIVVTPFAHEDAKGAELAVGAFQKAKEAGVEVGLQFWPFKYEGRVPTYADFAAKDSTPRC